MPGFYFHRTPFWMPLLYPKAIFSGDRSKPVVYLTFDDGPHPEITPWAMDLLQKYNATATFFCLGKMAAQNPAVLGEIISNGHTVGNHTFSHPNGWKSDNETYLEDIRQCQGLLNSEWFRPPYGKLKRSQYGSLVDSYRIVFWSLMPGDFDQRLSPEDCTKQCIYHIKPGDIVVLHDSEKAWPRLEMLLPVLLEHIRKKGWTAEGLDNCPVA